MFKLVRLFVVTSVIAFATVSAAVVFYRHSEVDHLIAFAESQNVALAQAFANTIWARFSSYVMSAVDSSEGALHAQPETRAIHEVLTLLTAGLPVLKVKIYNLHGLTVYSSESGEIGRYAVNNPGFISAAREGRPASKLTFRNTISSFGGTAYDRHLVESYLPIRQGDGPIEGVFELYSDLTPLVLRIEASTVKMAVGLFVIFGLLFGMFLVLVQRADATIKRQYADITKKNAALESEVAERKRAEVALTEAHDKLEQRVEDRTRKLTEEIAERRRAEDNLRKLSRAVEQSPAMTIITDLTGRIEYVNPRFTQVTGYTLEEITGKNPSILKSGEMPPEDYERLWHTIGAGKEWRGEIHNRKKNGELYWALTSISPIMDQQGAVTHFLAVAEDITQRKRVEEEARRHRNELAHTGRVIVMGEMATSLAHELNQPLTVISGCAQVCLEKLRSSDGTSEGMLDAVEQVAEQAQRASEIVRRTRSFLRKQEDERSLIDLNDTIRGVEDLLRVDAREQGATIELRLAAGLPHVWADFVQIQQVVLNLAHNGMEAMAGGNSNDRRLTIQTAAVDASTVEVAVRDTGPGIPTENLARVFDPFFTTKASGLGMGLAISRSIVEAHGGRFWAASNEGNGTVFRFALPGIEEPRTHDN